MKKLAALLLALCLLAPVPPALAARDTFTLMVYLCGTDLESEGGAASADLYEMVRAGVPEGGGLTVYVQTGGTRSWQTDGLTDGAAERWTLDQSGMQRVADAGRANMGAQETLADFLRYGFQRYPADRYGLILWDHGGGATGGVCSDELTDDALSYPELYAALQAATGEAGARFAFVGFDACLMGAYETAAHVAPFADYLLASEELEPGTGWDYEAWLPTLANDPGVDVEQLGKVVVDSFISSSVRYNRGEYATLSLCDLRELPALAKAVEGMGGALAQELASGGLSTISKLRQNMRSFGEISSDYASDMVDLTVFAEAYARYDSKSAKALKKALKSVVVYQKHTPNLTNVTGLSILLPYATRASAFAYLPDYRSLGLSPNYDAFVTDMLGGMADAGGYTLGTANVQQQSLQSAQVDWFSQYAADEQGYQSDADSLWADLYGSDYGQQNTDDFSLDDFLGALFASGDGGFNDGYDSGAASLWGDLDGDVDASFASDAAYTIGGQQADATVSVQTDAGEVALQNPLAGMGGDYAYTVQLTADQLDHLGSVEANLMMDISDPDFECYVELGHVQDVVVDWNRGKIYGAFDGTWATLDGQMVCLNDQIANERYIRSLIPVTVNGEANYLLVIFDEDAPGGEVVGYTAGYDEAGMPARGYQQLREGDVIVPQYELLYWDEDGAQQSEPFEGDPITVDASLAIPFGYEAVETDADYAYGFCLTDVYGGYAYTDFITLSF